MHILVMNPEKAETERKIKKRTLFIFFFLGLGQNSDYCALQHHWHQTDANAEPHLLEQQSFFDFTGSAAALFLLYLAIVNYIGKIQVGDSKFF